MTLNNFQAIAIYNAMCSLNDIGGKLTAKVDSISVYESPTGKIHIVVGASLTETHECQADFAEAYNLSF